MSLIKKDFPVIGSRECWFWIAALSIFTFFYGFLSIHYLQATEKRDYEIWGRKDKDIIIQPHIAPLIGVQQVSGPPIPEHGSLACEFKQDSMLTPKGDKIKILHGYCENGIVVTITGIDLNH